ncbi:ATP12 family chaperone protein [Pontixanthobacter aquaemixtae]|uniref:Molecular chaperone n=1 Tax=Pontixanthobacter aquaemixtae TaxID=1958940 RepID=A0A844ZRM0_9SPHN|nr:ATP12 family protein [Pontixanthobacter aquaemixtae]MXO89457.1 molecular chaperone [Pontixanthobacter aquaemixtae]
MKRFFKDVTVDAADDQFRVLLDGRAVKTQLGKPQFLPTQGLAEAMAAEWSEQGDKIDPARFRFRDLADFAIDMVAPDPDATVTKLLGFIETDTLCYRADPEEPLYRKQQEIWDPLLTAFEERESVSIERISGIMHKPQAPETHEKLSERLTSLDCFSLAALQTMTSLAASLTVGLSALEKDADPDALWRAANLEEDWQIELWGEDAEAADVRANRHADFLSAWNFAKLAGA